MYSRLFLLVLPKKNVHAENVETGRTQNSAPAAFGGQDEIIDESNNEINITASGSTALATQQKTTSELLKEARMSDDVIQTIKTQFADDLNADGLEEWMNDNMKKLPKRRLLTLIAKKNGVLWFSGRTGDYDWWMNATTDEYQYIIPNGSALIVPIPKSYFEDDSLVEKTEMSSSKKKWKRARAKLKTVSAMNKTHRGGVPKFQHK